jgi:hypothetical protein
VDDELGRMWKKAVVVSLEKLRKHIKIPEFESRISQIPLGDKFLFPNSIRRTPKHLYQSDCKFLQSCFATLDKIKPLNAELNPICPLLALHGAHHILHVRR